MPISEHIEYANVEDLHLDRNNPRLGRRQVKSALSQPEILEKMDDWTLDELALSFLESGFWTQEALVVVEERVGRENQLVVIEGNRRLAALQLLVRAYDKKSVPDRWKQIARGARKAQIDRLRRIPFVRADSRKEVQAYLGFRHVSGIKEWMPAEKAEFIAHLIEDEDLTYDQVRRRIGSKAPTVRRSYIAYKVLLQMETRSEEISIEKVEDRFSVLYLSLRTEGAQAFLCIDIEADPKTARKGPVPKHRLRQLEQFALWLFGTENTPPLVRDSRQTDQFGTILESPAAVDYLERTNRPSFQAAYRIAGGAEQETTEHIERAADEVEEALGTAHLYKSSRKLAGATERLGRDVMQLMKVFPAVWRKLSGEE